MHPYCITYNRIAAKVKNLKLPYADWELFEVNKTIWNVRWMVIVAILTPGLQVSAAQPKASAPAKNTTPAKKPPAPIPTAHAATPNQIDQAIEKATAFLYAHLSNGSWEGAPTADRNSGGVTAMAIHALLAADENSTDPRLKPAVEKMLKWPMRCPYVLCQRDQVLEMLPRTKENKALAWTDGNLLTTSLRTKGAANGLYYYLPGDTADYDHSVSQYGVLAMWACGQSGFEVPNGYWESVEHGWQHHQDVNGGWSYKVNGPGKQAEITASMTAAGVATLFITQDYVHSDEGLSPKGNIDNPAIDRGMKWLTSNFPIVFTGACSQLKEAQYYTLYGIERIGVAGGYKYFGTHDWYKEGANWLLAHQHGDGSWIGLDGPIPSTCFALFFLTRGREPVAFNKIQYDNLDGGKPDEGHWNERPRDIAKITRWIEKSTERNLNWHIVTLNNTPADALLDAPILYLAGDKSLDLAPADESKLKRYIENGGLILGNPDGGSELFLKSFQMLAAKLFPMYEMRPLPTDHPIYMHQQFRGEDIKSKDKLLGLSNGVRELMIIPTMDWGGSWQGDRFASQDAFRLAGNIYLYAAGRTSFRYGGPGMVYPNKTINPTTTVKLARLNYAGNADPEPAGWQRLAAILHNTNGIDLEMQTVKLGEGQLGGFKLAHLTGTARFTFNEQQRQEIQKFIEGGGTLLIDAAGGSTAFADAAEKELLAIFPKEATQVTLPIADTDPLYQGNIDIRYRRYLHDGEKRPKGPDLRVIKIGSRWAVLFSRQDISNGLVGRDVDGVVGYAPETATALVTAIVKQIDK